MIKSAWEEQYTGHVKFINNISKISFPFFALNTIVTQWDKFSYLKLFTVYTFHF